MEVFLHSTFRLSLSSAFCHLFISDQSDFSYVILSLDRLRRVVKDIVEHSGTCKQNLNSTMVVTPQFDLHVQLDSRCSCGAVFELENSPLLPSGEAEVGVDNFFLFDIHRLIVITFGIPTLQPHRHQSHLDLIFVSLFN